MNAKWFYPIAGIFLFATNPSVDQYSDWLVKEAGKADKGMSDPLTRLAAPYLVKAITTQQNYLLFSVFETEQQKFVGISQAFIPLPKANAAAPSLAAITPAPTPTPIDPATLQFAGFRFTGNFGETGLFKAAQGRDCFAAQKLGNTTLALWPKPDGMFLMVSDPAIQLQDGEYSATLTSHPGTLVERVNGIGQASAPTVLQLKMASDFWSRGSTGISVAFSGRTYSFQISRGIREVLGAAMKC